MMKFLFLPVLVFVLSTSALLIHPANKAQCSFRYNQVEKIVEVEMRFSDKDVEDFARIEKGMRIDLNKLSSHEVAQLFADYFSSHIVLRDIKGLAYKWQFVGFETKTPFVWFYLQAPFSQETMDKSSKPSIDVFCSLKREFNFLIDVYEDQTTLQSFITVCNKHTHHH